MRDAPKGREIFYGSYLLYQLLFLGWQRTLLTFLESYIALVQDGGSPTSDYYRKVIDVFDIYTQMSGIHFRVTNAWLKVSSMMFISVYYTAHEAPILLLLVRLVRDTLIHTSFLLIMNKVGTCLYPLVAILLMGMASDRMKHLRLSSTHQLQAPELPAAANSFPIRNFIWNRGSICDRDLVFDIFVYLIINATTYLQFLIGDNTSICKEGL
ncbi:uncharacterized protein CG1339-like [Drosophila serrata]|uniref:uncharacterized protein CG1339-like n=1 Tax=Drosophila serrata TaxID=7274 RepID=UPI000A1D1814|nr:uncharacterized protein CG1339-like [Drosophila serrata]